MATVLGLQVPDQFARDFNAGDVNQRVAMLTFIGRGDLANAAVKDWVEQTYGYLGAILDIPEINNLLVTAGREGWSPERIQGALSKTRYWKTHAASQREWLILASSDPAEAEKQIKAAKGQIATILSVHGVQGQMNQNQIDQLARKLLPLGVKDAAEMTKYVLSQIKFQPNAKGILGQGVNQIQDRANEFLVPIGPQGAFKRAQRVAMGQDTMEGIDAELRNLAKARWGHLADRLDAGYTMRDLIEPNIELLAKELEIDPDQIDPTDPRWIQIIDFVDPDTSQHRTMSLSETQQFVRSKSEYKATQGAQQQAASLGNTLLKTFGKAG